MKVLTNDPIILKRAKEAQEFLDKHPLPKEFLEAAKQNLRSTSDFMERKQKVKQQIEKNNSINSIKDGK